jgi:HprK-related kinase A
VIVQDLDAASVRHRLASAGLRVRVGPFVYDIRSTLPQVAAGIALHYATHPVEPDDGFADFHVSVEHPRGLRRWYRPQAHFRFDGDPPFNPLPSFQAFPLLEWGMNWCISAHANRWLILHAAVLERGGRALLLPAPSGAGKSTLTAALMLRGWRLFSDELALIDPASGHLQPVPRPVSLKNRSIDIVREFDAGAVIGDVVPDTVKGSVAHLRPLAQHVRRAAETARAAWIVVPHYVAGANVDLQPLPKSHTLMRLADNAFNYDVHGRRGFRTLVEVVDGSECLGITYSRLDDAIAVLEHLCSERLEPAAPPVAAKTLHENTCATDSHRSPSIARSS